jgi:hypothetical protein
MSKLKKSHTQIENDDFELLAGVIYTTLVNLKIGMDLSVDRLGYDRAFKQRTDNREKQLYDMLQARVAAHDFVEMYEASRRHLNRRQAVDQALRFVVRVITRPMGGDDGAMLANLRWLAAIDAWCPFCRVTAA